MDEKLTNGWRRRVITNSSRIKEIQWRQYPLHNNSLYKLKVTFAKGGTYLYKGVTYDDINQLLNAESKGKAFESLIKGHYQYEKL